jgi:hypothetical protein
LNSRVASQRFEIKLQRPLAIKQRGFALALFVGLLCLVAGLLRAIPGQKVDPQTAGVPADKK